MYKKEDYKILKKYYDDDLLIGAKLLIKGAVFHLYRQYIIHTSKGVIPSSIFKFTSYGEFVNKNPNEYIELGWTTSGYGMMKIGEELGLTLHDGAGCFSMGNSKIHYVDEKM